MNLSRNHDVAGSIPGLAQWVGESGIAVSCGVGRRGSSDPALLWLWRRLAVIAPVGPLAWEPPYAVGAAQEMAKRQKKKIKTISSCSGDDVSQIRKKCKSSGILSYTTTR